MSAKRTVITITHRTESFQTAKDLLLKPSSKPRQAMVWFSRFFDSVAGGQRSAKIAVKTDTGEATAASGTFTFTNHAANNDTVSINGVTFTAKTSGAVGNQWNIGSTATATATNLAAAINASVTAGIINVVTASSLAGVVTITTVHLGSLGNNLPFSVGTDTGSVNTASGATLANGVDSTTVSATSTFHCGV